MAQNAHYGQMLPPNALLIRTDVAQAEMGGMRYQMQVNTRYEPIVENTATGKRFLLGWEDIFKLAQAAGIDRQDEAGHESLAN